MVFAVEMIELPKAANGNVGTDIVSTVEASGVEEGVIVVTYEYWEVNEADDGVKS